MNKIMYLFLPMLLCGSPVLSQSASNKLQGVWTLAAVENVDADGTKTFPYGQSPVGMLIFNSDDTYAIQIMKAVRPRLASNDKNKATSEEYSALVQGNNSHFGRYKVNETNGTIMFYIDHAFYPNWEGTVQERSYTLRDDLLEYVVTNTTNGGPITATVVWRRKK